MSNQTSFPFCLPTGMSSETFLNEYWQKKPLVIRNGMPQIKEMFEPQDILELALQEDVNARLISQVENAQGAEQWKLKLSPLTENDFENLPEKWSVLVQNLEQWTTELGEYWQHFAYIPQWQRDDIMVSYAPKGGSVGRHYDEYDVFLVQGYGHRRWQLGKWCTPETEFQADQPIRVFDDMGELIFDEILAPGDVLYIPSRLSHYGVAQDECLTFSFGLRQPSMLDLFQGVDNQLKHPTPYTEISQGNIPVRAQPGIQPNGEIHAQTISKMKSSFIDYIANSSEFDQIFKHAVATSLSKRRYELLTDENEYYPDELEEGLKAGDYIVQDANCHMLYLSDPLVIYVNGEWLDEVNSVEANILRHLADGGCFDWQYFEQVTAEMNDELAKDLVLDSVCSWLENGWLVLHCDENNEESNEA